MFTYIWLILLLLVKGEEQVAVNTDFGDIKSVIADMRARNLEGCVFWREL